MIAFWLGVLLGSVGLAMHLWLVRGASDLTATAEDEESLVETLWVDLSVAQRELAEERDRADWLAEELRALSPRWSRASLHAHDAARAAEVAR